MSNIEQIKAEIERLKKLLEVSNYYLDNSQQALGYSFALDDFSAFIDSLPDEPVDYAEELKKCKDNPLYFYDKYVKVKQEHSEVDLEKEIDACWRNWLSPSNQKEVEGILPKTEFAMYARHFYELGLKARKEE